MKIHNTEELVKRADWHAKNDHITQGTYGVIEANGHVDYRGCAIACLGVPRGKKRLEKYLRGLLAGGSGRVIQRRDVWEVDEDFHREELRREFGMPDALIAEIEEIFEGFQTHGAAIEFVPDFARALRPLEGVKLTDDQVQKFLDSDEYPDVQWGFSGAERAAGALFGFLKGRAKDAKRRSRVATA